MACQSFRNGIPEWNFGNTSPTAGWRATIVTHETYIQSERILSPYLCIPGFRLETVFGDLLHDLYLGSAQQAIASGIIEFMEHNCLVQPNGAPFADAKEMLLALNKDCRLWAEGAGKRKPRVLFTLASLGRGSKTDYPELSSKFKAAHVKTLIHWMSDLTSRLVNLTCERSKCMASLFWVLSQFVQTTDSAGRFLTPLEHSDVLRAGGMFTSGFARMAKYAFDSSECLWKVRPKLHYLEHHFLDSANINPRFVHAFGEEDFVGKMAHIGRGCSRMTMPRRVFHIYIYIYILLLPALRWYDRLMQD